MDVVTLALAKKGAKSYTDTVINNLPKGVVYKGSVNYYADLPSAAALGDCYTVVYKGTTGTESYGAEYIWGLNTATNVREWIKIGEEVDLSGYATEDWVNEQISDFLPDAETYKTAELIEGQITDVIGVSDILIKGQTSQDGEPTPDSPADVNVVSGSNVINIKSKNLININKLTPGYVLGTGDFSTQSTNEEMYSEFIKVLPNTEYTFKIFETTWSGFNSSNWIGIGEYRNTQINSFIQRDVMGTGTQKYYTITTTANTNYIVVSARGLVSATKIQLEEGTATDYTPYYQGKELPLDLPVENLFDKTDYIQGKAYMNNVVTENQNWGIYYLPCINGETYTISGLKGYAYTQIVQCNQNKEFISNIDKRISTKTIYTIAATQNGYIGISFVCTNLISLGNELDTMQIERGSKANAYTPYGTEPIELCKIGNYQDYFYKSGSKWYLHKEIDKTILNGTEGGRVSSGTGFYRFIFSNNNFKNDTSLATKNILISDMFKGVTFNARNTDYNETCYQISNGGTDGAGIGINTNIASTVNDFKTWLASNNVTVYYVLATPTDTEITGTLKEQLETIYNAPLYEQTNITQTNNDLPMVLDITACKDNINGIKAFIRK